MNTLSIKKEKVIAWACAACILLQTESMFPSSIVLMAISSFLLAPSLFLTRFKKYFFTEHCKWIAILLSIMVRNKTCLFPTVLIQKILNENHYSINFKISVGVLPAFSATSFNLFSGIADMLFFLKTSMTSFTSFPSSFEISLMVFLPKPGI